MIRLQPAGTEDRDLLWNINQKYLYEMTGYYKDPMDAEGNYHYGHFEEYFTDPGREALLIYRDETLIGFAMLCPYSYIGRDPDYTMAEFTIFPAFRRNHYARETAEMILARRPGRWEIKYNEKNTGAAQLWNSVAAPFGPEKVSLNQEETVLTFVR